MNNKGMTVIELLVAFTLLMLVSIGLFRFITIIKEDLQNKNAIKELTDYSNIMNNKIHEGLIKEKPFTFAYKNDYSDNFICKSTETCTISNNVLTTKISNKTKELNLDNLCLNKYPCLVYTYLENSEIKEKTIIFNLSKVDLEYGIKYDKVFEPLPEYAVFLKENKPKIEIDNRNFLIINYPFYIVGDNNNYGFKIAYKVGLK